MEKAERALEDNRELAGKLLQKDEDGMFHVMLGQPNSANLPGDERMLRRRGESAGGPAHLDPLGWLGLSMGGAVS